MTYSEGSAQSVSTICIDLGTSLGSEQPQLTTTTELVASEGCLTIVAIGSSLDVTPAIAQSVSTTTFVVSSMGGS